VLDHGSENYASRAFVTAPFSAMQALDDVAQSRECSRWNRPCVKAVSGYRSAIDDEALPCGFPLESLRGEVGGNVQRSLRKQRVTGRSRQQHPNVAVHCRVNPESGSWTEPEAYPEGDGFPAEGPCQADSSLDQPGAEDYAIARSEGEAPARRGAGHLHGFELGAEHRIAQIFDPPDVETLPNKR
jgi:hypothetical protein